MLWPKNLNKKIKTRLRLAAYTTFKIGGPARFFFEPENLKQLQDILVSSKARGIPVLILGEGSNILVSDAGVNALVVRLSSDAFKTLRYRGRYLLAGSGLKLNRLLIGAKKKGLSGLEFLAGIPGTVGGAVAGNAGAWGRSIADLVEEARVLDYNGKEKIFNKRQLKFAYRRSNLGKYVIIGVKLKLSAARPREISSRTRHFLKERALSQGSNLPNAGCIFKNPSARHSVVLASGSQTTALWPAGRLIDACGLKGRSAGGAAISLKHANFILNNGRAKSRDVLALMRLIRSEVKKRFKACLEPEIKIWK